MVTNALRYGCLANDVHNKISLDLSDLLQIAPCTKI